MTGPEASRPPIFHRTAFTGNASFSEAAFGGEANFPEVDFRGDALFSGAGALHFDQARMLSPGASHLWPTGWHLTVAGSAGYTVIRSDGDGGS